jgi:MraZ protein
MLLTGTFPRTIDDKQRIAVPKRIRDLMGKGGEPTFVIVAPGTDHSLVLYTEEAFSRLAEQLSAASPVGQDVRAFSRLFFSQAEHLEIDSQSRIRLSPELAAHAQLQKDIVLVGVRDHVEIWDQVRWNTYIEQRRAQYDELAEKSFAQM